METKNTDFKALEQTIMSGFMQAAAETIGHYLSQHDIDSPFVDYDGRRYYKSSTHEVAYFTCAGKVRVNRSLYRDKVFGRSICPLNLTVGIIRENWTPQAAKVATLATTDMTPYAAEKLFQEIGGMAPSKSSLDRLPKRINDVLNLQEQTLANQVREVKPIPKEATQMAASMDEVHAPNPKTQRKKRYQIDRRFRETWGNHILIDEDYSRYREAQLWVCELP